MRCTIVLALLAAFQVSGSALATSVTKSSTTAPPTASGWNKSVLGRRIRALFQAAKVAYPAPQLYLRAFKREGELELWAGASPRALTAIKSYRICATSGVLGPKRQEGDGQVPEGFYEITGLRRHTRFHRSMSISYPNRLDRLLGRTGGAILIHGKCVTIGCLPIEDEPVEELFEIVLATRRRYPRATIPVHIFPLRMDGRGMTHLAQLAAANAELLRFWRDLRPAYLAFESTGRLSRITLGPERRYRLEQAAPAADRLPLVPALAPSD